MKNRRTRWMVTLPIIVVTLLFGLLTPANAATIGATVTIDDGLSFASVTVTPGQAVEFVNAGTDRHRMRSTSGPSEFDTGDIDPDESTTVVLSAVGTYLYEDHRNDHDARYEGTIIVSNTPSLPSPDPTPGPSPTPTPTSSAVRILDRSFSPASISVTAGTTVEWTNVSGRDHTTTANDRSFDSGNMAEGAIWSRTFATPGTFAYFCVIHPDMTGVVAVSAVGTPPPPPPPPPTTTAAAPPPPPSTIPTTPAPGPATGTINIVDFSFDPASTSIRVGDTLVWQNFGVAPHTVTADDRSFDSGFLNTGQSYQRTFGQVGTYAYYCTIHPDMQAVVAVGGLDEPPPPPPPTPAAPPTTTPAPSSPTVGGATPPRPGRGTVQMLDFAFSAATTNARVGDTIVWDNVGAAPHTATARDGSFDTGFVMAGERASTQLTTAGSFAFYCTIHPEMTGTLVVADAPAGLDLTDLGDVADDPVSVGVDEEIPVSAEGTNTAGDTDPTTDTNAQAITQIDVIDFNYAPRHLEVEQGSTLTFAWLGDAPHTVTDRDGAFDSGILQKGATWSQTFDSVGRVSYYCTLHPDMTGVIDVVAPPAEEPFGDAPVLAASPSRDGGMGPGTKGLIGGGIFFLGGALFLYAALLFMQWAAAEESRLNGSSAH